MQGLRPQNEDIHDSRAVVWPTGSSDSLRFGPYEVDPRIGVVRKYGLKVKLSGQPLEILLLLLKHPGELVTREEIRERLWPEGIFVDFEASLNSVVKKLRRALNDDPLVPLYIETCPRKGYRFIGELEHSLPAETDAGVEDHNSDEVLDFPSSGTTVVSKPRRQEVLKHPCGLMTHRERWMTAVAIGTLVVVSAVWIARHGFATYPWHTTAPTKQVPFRASIALLGLRNLSPRPDAEWHGAAVMQMLATEMAKGERVRIIPDENVSQAKAALGLGTTADYSRDVLRALRADLGSDYVVTGSYLFVGDRDSGQVRVDLRLQEAISGETLARVAVSGKQSEILEMVARAGEEIRGKLGSTVPPEGDVDWRTVLPLNPEAARLYSEGLARMRVFEYLPASELLQRSTAIEPAFAMAHATLAEARSHLGDEMRALATAQEALSLATSLPEDERLSIEGHYYELKHDWPGAIGAYRHLWHDFPDDLESGLKLAEAQSAGGDLGGAAATISSLRTMPSSQVNDPRIDLAEAALSEKLADYVKQQSFAEAAARKAQSSGARLLLGYAKLAEGQALSAQSRMSEAIEAYTTAWKIFNEAGDRTAAATALKELGAIRPKSG